MHNTIGQHASNQFELNQGKNIDLFGADIDQANK
jgi:hypothetical protein